MSSLGVNSQERTCSDTRCIREFCSTRQSSSSQQLCNREPTREMHRFHDFATQTRRETPSLEGGTREQRHCFPRKVQVLMRWSNPYGRGRRFATSNRQHGQKSCQLCPEMIRSTYLSRPRTMMQSYEVARSFRQMSRSLGASSTLSYRGAPAILRKTRLYTEATIRTAFTEGGATCTEKELGDSTRDMYSDSFSGEDRVSDPKMRNDSGYTSLVPFCTEPGVRHIAAVRHHIFCFCLCTVGNQESTLHVRINTTYASPPSQLTPGVPHHLAKRWDLAGRSMVSTSFQEGRRKRLRCRTSQHAAPSPVPGNLGACVQDLRL